MKTTTQQSLISRLIALKAGAPASAGRSTILDTRRYRDPDELVVERERIFRALPLVAAHVSELPNEGDVIRADVAGTALIVARDAQGISVFINACSHRGAELVSEPACGKKALTCPYHAWSYGLDGALLHVPGEDSFGALDKAQFSLTRVAHEERHGFIWVQLQGGEPSVGSFLGASIDEDFSAFALSTHRCDGLRSRSVSANWKLVMDAFAEGYHLKSLHRRSLARFFLDESILDDFAPHVRQVGARRRLDDVTDTPAQWDVREHATVFYNVFPNSILVFHPTWASWLTLWPEAVDRVRVDHRMLVPQGASTPELAKSFRHIDEEVFEKEDLMIAASIQRTLAGGTNETMLLGAQEEGMRLFHAARDRALATGSSAA